MRCVLCITLCFAVMLTLCSACGNKDANPVPDASLEESDSGYAGFRNTILYYGSDEGFVVPVMRRIPWEEGIGKAALQYLVDDAENRSAIAPYGLRALIPEGTNFSLRIGEDRHATVDLSSLPSDTEDINSVSAAIVNTLTEFESIDTVSISVNGEPLGDIAAQSSLSEPLSAMALNVPDGAVAVSTGQSYRMVLYYPNASASLNVPVTRYESSQPNFLKAVEALIEGKENESLMNCFPAGTTVYRAEIENDAAVVDLSSDYLQVKETDGLLQAGYDTLFLTAQCFAPIDTLRLTVNGETIEDMPMLAPLYANEIE